MTSGIVAHELFGEDPAAVSARVFNNWEELLVTNVAFLSDLELKQEHDDGLVAAPGSVILEHVRCTTRMQAKCDLPTDIAHVWQIAGMSCYRKYTAGQKQALDLIVEYSHTRPNVAKFLKQAQSDPRCGSLDLGSFLLKPLQRITRYPLLIKQVRACLASLV